MAPRILGLHHVTATVDEAQPDLDFCIDLLGLRLVKKTVNFDNHNVFHFYYGTELGAPGTIWTTFPYAGYGVREGIKGTGQVITTAFSVPTGSLEFWWHRLKEKGVVVADIEAYFKEPAIAFSDPSGLRFVDGRGHMMQTEDARSHVPILDRRPLIQPGSRLDPGFGDE